MMRKTLDYWIGTGFGSGLLPKAPGTWGSLAVLLPAWLSIQWFGWVGLSILFLLCIGAGFATGGRFEKQYGKDPALFVMDEWAGQLIPLFVMFLIPDLSASGTILVWVGAFVLFRFFDIYKPLGIDRTQHFSGAAGIMIDDILAGIYALITLFLSILVVLTSF
jgi:phosphatidylglycerophosphatase A